MNSTLQGVSPFRQVAVSHTRDFGRVSLRLSSISDLIETSVCAAQQIKILELVTTLFVLGARILTWIY